jgi:hypothetical protein
LGSARKPKQKASDAKYGNYVNPVASASPEVRCGVSERMGKIIIPYGSKILRSLLRRASNAAFISVCRIDNGDNAPQAYGYFIHVSGKGCTQYVCGTLSPA